MKHFKTVATATALLALALQPARAQTFVKSCCDDGAKAGDLAPITVMGDHMHPKGDWMVSLRTGYMNMEQMQDGTDTLTSNEILTSSTASPTDYIVTPTAMTGKMIMVGGMYGLTDTVSLMVMGGYGEKRMEHVMDSTNTFTTESNGLLDTNAMALVRLFSDDTHHLHINAGLSLPTGQTDQTDATPMNANQRLPFKMQMGSGTFDLLPGITYVGNHGNFNWGAQYGATFRLGENDEDYTLGDEHQVTTWGGYNWTENWSTSLRFTGSHEGKVDGAAINNAPMMNPTFDPDNYGGERVEAGLGVNYLGKDGILDGHRIGFEVSIPLHENLNGPQMSRDWRVGFGWLKSF